MSGSGGGVRYRESDKRWEARYYGADGRRHSVFAKTEREAKAKLRGAMLQADAGIRPVANRQTVAEWLDEWLATSVAPNRRPRTLESYEDTCRRYIVPSVGRIPLAKLQPEDVSRMTASLTARGTLSPTTVRYAYAVLRIALGRALKSQRVLRNVATLVDPVSKATPEMRPLSAERRPGLPRCRRRRPVGRAVWPCDRHRHAAGRVARSSMVGHRPGRGRADRSAHAPKTKPRAREAEDGARAADTSDWERRRRRPARAASAATGRACRGRPIVG
jgi:hypothetical protein